MNIEEVGYVDLPKADELQVATRLFPEPTKVGNMTIQEMKINGGLSPDIAFIETSGNTPVQFYNGEGDLTDIFYSTTDNKPIGLILMSPEGEVALKVYNPKTDGGGRGYAVTKGWTIQTIVPEGTTLKFFDYWSPKGYTEKEGDRMYGETVVSTVTDEKVLEKFRGAEKELLDYMKKL